MNEDDFAIPAIPLQLQHELLAMPPGTYGLSYDILTRPTKDPPEEGWGSPRRPTYAEIARILWGNGFHRLQKSDWFAESTTAIYTYWTMLSLMRVRPAGKVQSTLGGLKAHHIRDWALDVTAQVRLGGEYSPSLRGPTPSGLVPDNVPSLVPLQPPAPLPKYTKPSPQAAIAENWRIPP